MNKQSEASIEWRYFNSTVVSRNQVIVGNGSAAYGASRVIVWPCLTVTDFRPTLLMRGFTEKKEDDVQYGSYLETVEYVQKRGLAMTTFDGSLGSDGPALLIATTRNSYSFPSCRPPQAPLFCRPSISAPYIQNDGSYSDRLDAHNLPFAIDRVLFRVVQSRTSQWAHLHLSPIQRHVLIKTIILGSCARTLTGGCHCRSTWSLSQSATSGWPGASGSSKGFFANVAPLVSNASLSPSLFTARTRKRYSFPAVSLFTFNEVLSPWTSPAGAQPPRATSCFSTTYRSIVDPPLSRGGFHETTHVSLVTSVTFIGPSGGPGRSVRRQISEFRFDYSRIALTENSDVDGNFHLAFGILQDQFIFARVTTFRFVTRKKSSLDQ